VRTGHRTIGALVLGALVATLLGGCAQSDSTTPACDDPGGRAIVLIAQSVPTATRLPCLESLPAGWSLGGAEVRDSGTAFWLDSVVIGIHSVEVTLTETCDAAGASAVVPAEDEAGAQVSVLPTSLDPYRSSRFIVFEGGCVTYRYAFSGGTAATVALQIDASLSFLPRDAVGLAVREDTEQTLCGAGAPPCVEGP
jgi:hypothetical protein